MRITGWILIGAAILIGTPAASRAGEMSVQVRQTELRSTPSFLGAVVATLNYGDRVTVLEKKGAWVKVSTPAQATGWVSASALTTQRVKLTAGETAQTGASSGELALAGKGFNSDVEAEYKKAHRDISFAGIDRMEKNKIPPKTLQDFLKAGSVAPAKGGAAR